MTITQIASVALCCALLAAFAGLWAFQTYGVYRFNPEPTAPETLGITGLRAATFRSEDGAEVGVWLLPPAPDKPVLISFFGNFAAIGNSFARMRPLTDQGYGVAMLVYRGSGGAAGQPSEAVIAADARALYDQLDRLMGTDLPANRRVIHGLSLGTSFATGLARDRRAQALILEAGYDRLCRYFQKRARGLPLCLLMWRERHDAIGKIVGITMPVLIAHGGRDRVVLPEWSRLLFDAAPAPKAYRLYPEGGHADLLRHGLAGDIPAFLADPAGFAAR